MLLLDVGDYGIESFQYEDKTAWTVPLQRVASMENEREQELGQFGSVTGAAKALEMLNAGSSFESVCKAARHLWKAIQVRCFSNIRYVTCSQLYRSEKANTVNPAKADRLRNHLWNALADIRDVKFHGGM